MLYTENYCKVKYLHLNNRQSKRICGWSAVFMDMKENQLVETNEYTGKMTKHTFCACPDESGHRGNFVWRNFIKFLQTN